MNNLIIKKEAQYILAVAAGLHSCTKYVLPHGHGLFFPVWYLLLHCGKPPFLRGRVGRHFVRPVYNKARQDYQQSAFDPDYKS